MYIMSMKDDKLEKLSKKAFALIGYFVWIIFLLVLVDIFIK